MQTLKHVFNSNRYAAFLVFFAAAAIIFWPAREAGFVTDWIGGQINYENGTFWGALNSFGWRAIIPLMFLSNFTLFKLFGTWWLPWFVVFVGLHALNAALLFRLLRRLLEPDERANWLAFSTAALFLCSPYAAEPVIWKACIHYQLSFVLFLWAAHRCIDYCNAYRLRDAAVVWGLCIAGVYLSEWMVVAPAILAFLTLTCTLTDGGWQHWQRRFGVLIAPLFGIVAAWLLINKMALGHWTGHYGDETHLNLDVLLLLSNALKYFVKYIFFVRYLSGAWQALIYGVLESKLILIGVAGGLAVFFAFWVTRFRSLPFAVRWSGFALGMFFGAILPVANLFFYTLLYSENDRYGYFASPFIWLAALLWLSPLARPTRLVITGVLLALSIFLLVRMSIYWGRAEDVYSSLIEDFRWFDKQKVIMLASPDNYRGISVARIIGAPSGFKDALYQRRRQPFTGQMWEVVQYNMHNVTDGTKVAVDSTGLQYTIGFMQDGNWFWRNGIGADNYETEAFRFTKNEWDATVALRAKDSSTVLIYPVGGKWMEVE